MPSATFPSGPSGFYSLSGGAIGSCNWNVQEKIYLTANFTLVSLTICDLYLPLCRKGSKESIMWVSSDFQKSFIALAGNALRS